MFVFYVPTTIHVEFYDLMYIILVVEIAQSFLTGHI